MENASFYQAHTVRTESYVTLLLTTTLEKSCHAENEVRGMFGEDGREDFIPFCSCGRTEKGEKAVATCGKGDMRNQFHITLRKIES